MSAAVAVIGPIFALICAGFLARQFGMLTREAVRGLAQLVVGIEIPALLFRSLAGQHLLHDLDLRINLVYFGGCFAVLAVSLLLARFVLGLDRSQAGVFGLSAMYSNSSLLGVPIIHQVFGASGLVLLSKIIAFHSLLLLPAGTLLVALGRNGRTRLLTALGKTALLTLGNPIVLGLLAGVLWSLTGLGLSAPADKVLGMLSDAATPTALLALGGLQGRIGLRQVNRAAASVGLKLILHPVAVGVLALCVGGLTREAVAVAIITAALPAGVNVYLLAQQYDVYVAEATAATTLGTVMSVASIAVALQIGLFQS